MCLKPGETTAHMMYECERVQPILLYTLDILDQLYPENYPHENSLKFLLFGYSALTADREFGHILLETLKTEIYYNRMNSYHSNKSIDLRTILKKYENKIKHLLYEELEIIKSLKNLDKHKNEILNIFNKKGYLNLVANTQQYLNIE